MKLHFTPGSPFARMVRVLLRELQAPCEEVEITDFPPSAAYFAVNPLGQVPALQTDRGMLFPTRLIIDHVMRLPRRPESRVARALRRHPDAWQDEQILDVLLLMGDALAAIKYQAWAGLRPSQANLIGFDPAERHAARVQSTLDWLEMRTTLDGFLPDHLSIQDIALACVLLWADARGGFPWRGRPNIEAIVTRCASRPSFAATVPQPWP